MQKYAELSRSVQKCVKYCVQDSQDCVGRYRTLSRSVQESAPQECTGVHRSAQACPNGVHICNKMVFMGEFLIQVLVCHFSSTVGLIFQNIIAM